MTTVMTTMRSRAPARRCIALILRGALVLSVVTTATADCAVQPDGSGTVHTLANATTILTFSFFQCQLNELNMSASPNLVGIGVNAFATSGIRTLNFGSTSVVRIEERTFYQCGQLDNVTFRGSVVSFIGTTAFAESGSLVLVDLSHTLSPIPVTIAAGAFDRCGLLTTLHLRDSKVAAIGVSAFSLCTSLRRVDFFGLPITTISSFAFASCNSLAVVGFQGSLVNVIELSAFAASSLRALDFSGLTINISDSAFQNAPALLSLDLAGANVTIGVDAFRSTGIRYMSAGNSTIVVEDASAFGGCDDFDWTVPLTGGTVCDCNVVTTGSVCPSCPLQSTGPLCQFTPNLTCSASGAVLPNGTCVCTAGFFGARCGSATASPTSTPTVTPTRQPTGAPSTVPSTTPSDTPTQAPLASTLAPVAAPTRQPTAAPSTVPSATPSAAPPQASLAPTDTPSLQPTHVSSLSPSAASPTAVVTPTTTPESSLSGIGLVMILVAAVLICIVTIGVVIHRRKPDSTARPGRTKFMLSVRRPKPPPEMYINPIYTQPTSAAPARDSSEYRVFNDVPRSSDTPNSAYAMPSELQLEVPAKVEVEYDEVDDRYRTGGPSPSSLAPQEGTQTGHYQVFSDIQSTS